MKRYEYRIEPLVFTMGGTMKEQLLEALNRYGREGWRLNHVAGTAFSRPRFSWKGGITLVLEREINESL